MMEANDEFHAIGATVYGNVGNRNKGIRNLAINEGGSSRAPATLIWWRKKHADGMPVNNILCLQ